MSYRGAALMQGQTNLLPFLQTYQTSPQTYTGTLAAGTYTFTGDLHGNGDINDHGTANFSLDFTVGQTAPPPTSAVPLPPSFWLALPILGGITLWFGRRSIRLI